MFGYLFILKKPTISTTFRNAKLLISEQLKQKGLEQINKDDLIFVGTLENDNSVTLWLVAKAKTKLVIPANGKPYVGLKFQRMKKASNCYTLCDGIVNRESLHQEGWQKLDTEEVAACLIDTKIYASQLQTLKNVLDRVVPRGLGIDTKIIHDSVLYNASRVPARPVLRKWYNSEVLLDEGKYRDALKRRLSELKGYDFEKLMEEFFKIKSFGFNISRVTKQTRDGGIDLILCCESDAFGKITMIGQCKHISSTVSEKEVKQLKTDLDDNRIGATRAIFVTTSYFSVPAKKYAESQKSLHLIDGDDLTDLFFRHAEQTPKLWEIIGRREKQPTLPGDFPRTRK